MFEIPTHCPACSQEVIIEKLNSSEVLRCINPICPAKFRGRLLQFIGANGIDIESLSTATIDFLIEQGWVNSFSDIFRLKEHREDWKSCKGFGSASVDKILDSIPTSVELWRIIAVCGINGVGKHTAKLLCEHFSTYEDFRNAVRNNYPFENIKGIGTKISQAILSADYSEMDRVVEYITIKQSVSGSLVDKTFCITGTLSDRRDNIVKLIEAHGGKVASIGKSTDYLICNDKNSTSSKMKKARELNIPVISEEEFRQLIKE